MQTEYTFTLPNGYRDAEGVIHKNGTMRLATARDELDAVRDFRTRSAPEYMTIVLLSRVITKLEGCDCVTPEMIADMYTVDANFLQNMYETINNNEEMIIHVTCPHCGKEFDEPINFSQRD